MKTLNTLLAIAAVASAVLVQHAHASSSVSTPSTAKPLVECNLHLTSFPSGQQLLAGTICINNCVNRVNK